MTPLPYLHLERHVSMDSTSEENKDVTAVEKQAAAQPEKAAEKAEPKHEAPASKEKQERRHDGRRHDDHRRSKGRPGPDKPAAPMGALQQALKKTKSSSDWKAFHDAQVAAGREQKTFWLTAAEAERVRRFIHKIREKAEKEAARQAEIAARKAKEAKEGKKPQAPKPKSIPNPVKAQKTQQAQPAASEAKPEGQA